MRKSPRQKDFGPKGKQILRSLKRAVIISLFFLVGVAFAEEDLIINADVVEYDEEGKFIEASGEVVATYKGMELNAPHIVYDTSDRRIFADGAFTLTLDEQWIEGDSLDYWIDTKRGSAKNVDFIFKGVYLKGRAIELDPEVVNLSGASFTSCDIPASHYRISAASVVLYPKSKWLAAYWGWFFVGPVPLVPVPTYIYDLGPGRRRNTLPIPEVGSNDEDGTYIIERLAWHSSQRLYGFVSLTYASKKGPGGGVEGNYIADESDSYNARVHTSQGDGLWGGLTYLKSFGGEVGERRQSRSLYDSWFKIPKKKKMEFEVNLSSRERINFYRISFLPDVALRLNEDRFLGFKYSGEVRSGRVLEEETTLEASRTALYGDVSYDFLLLPSLTMTLGSDYSGRWYSESSIWQTVYGKLSFRQRWTEAFESGIGYRHLALNDGNSPFSYEKYWFRPSHEMFVNSIFDFYGNRLGASFEYYIPSWDAKDIDYFASTRIHCFDLTATYRVLRREFNLGISLVVE
jgi:hypothetical protein